ncbi:hypothetical protein PanWU01x14_145030 [Parasponia andersonii]|uniref:RNase H type-1 domain-containing protein n=1 Tax=Parasponia andersonii TaxID=3476 RepID=A0A2P5CKK4_PARAD|nr:hypothetical protein PanWU01x14_145030 [Parasponia andersonii]
MSVALHLTLMMRFSQEALLSEWGAIVRDANGDVHVASSKRLMGRFDVFIAECLALKLTAVEFDTSKVVIIFPCRLLTRDIFVAHLEPAF